MQKTKKLTSQLSTSIDFQITINKRWLNKKLFYPGLRKTSGKLRRECLKKNNFFRVA